VNGFLDKVRLDPEIARLVRENQARVAAIGHDRACHCAECVPCVHHPGEDCDCYCRFCIGCVYENCAFWQGPQQEA
jgi:hypothetical protein